MQVIGDEFIVVTDWILNYWTNSLLVYTPPSH